MRASTDMTGIKVGGMHLNNIRNDDDIPLNATSQVNLQRLGDRVVEKSTVYDMELKVRN